MHCRLNASLDCWVYTPLAETIPAWAIPYLMAEHSPDPAMQFGKVTFTPEHDDDAVLEEGDALVRLPGSTQVILVEAETFKRYYDVLPEAGRG